MMSSNLVKCCSWFLHMQLFLRVIRVKSETTNEFYRWFPLQKCILALTLLLSYTLNKLWHRKYFQKGQRKKVDSFFCWVVYVPTFNDSTDQVWGSWVSFCKRRSIFSNINEKGNVDLLWSFPDLRPDSCDWLIFSSR